MRVHHTNLANVVGYCNEGDHLALIYEFVPNGDLRQHLSGKLKRFEYVTIARETIISMDLTI